MALCKYISFNFTLGSTWSFSHLIMSSLKERLMYLFSKSSLYFPHDWSSGSCPVDERYITNMLCKLYPSAIVFSIYLDNCASWSWAL